MYENKTLAKVLRQLVGYGTASLLALAADVSLLAMLVRYAHLDYVLAATLSFIVGAGVAYVASIRLAFSEHRLVSRKTEFVCFLALGVIGLLVNAIVISSLTGIAGMNLFAAKACAAGLTFGCNFTLRRKLLFETSPQPQETRDVANHA